MASSRPDSVDSSANRLIFVLPKNLACKPGRQLSSISSHDRRSSWSIVDHMAMEARNNSEFITRWRQHELLWNVVNDEYHNKQKREMAFADIANAMRMNVESVKQKIKNLRSYFNREYKKVIQSKSSSEAAQEPYHPTWEHFSSLLFLKDGHETRTSVQVLKQKILAKKPLNSERHDDRDEDEDKDRISILEDQLEAENGPSHSNSQGADRKIISDGRENKAEPPVSKASGIKRKIYILPQKATASKLSSNQSDILTAVDKLNEVSQLSASMVSQKQDMYSHFGDYVASVLRETGGQTAMLIIHEISNVIFKHMTGSSPYPSAPSHVSSASSPLSPYESSSHGSIVGQSMQETQQDNEQLD